MNPILATILLFIIILPCLLVTSELPACAELTEKDIQQIRQIIREELEPIKIEIAELKITVSEMNKRMDEKFKAVEDKISLIQWFIGLLVAIVVAAIAIPQLLILYRERVVNFI